jgi:glucose/arabinose dehydrogenase
MAAILAGLAAILILPARAGAAVALQPVGSFSSPIFVASPPGDPRLFVVERGGTIQVVDNGVTSQFLDIHTQTTTDGERGLLSMAFDPNYASNGLFYVFYTSSSTAGTLGEGHVDEFHVSSNPDVADPASQRPVLTITRPSASASNHNGGQLQFGPDGLLYISVGDGGTGGSPAQDPNVLNGKMLRIDPHVNGANPYSVPPSNPFVGVAGADEIWSLGLRNPWRFSFDHLTGDIAIGDVGEGSREEVDWVPQVLGLGRNANYGWPCREGFIAGPAGPGPCSGALTNPIFDYPHTNPGGGAAFGCAIVGGYVYRGNQVPELAGRYVYMDLCTKLLRSLVPGYPFATDDRSEGVSVANSPFGFGEDANCNLYLAVGTGNQVVRVVSTSPPSVAPACVTSAATAPPVPGAQPQPQPVFQRACKKHRKHHKHRRCKKKHKKKHRAA